MGGYRFKTTGDGWSPILGLGALFHLNQVFDLSAGWVWGGSYISTELPMATDLRTGMQNNGYVQISTNLAELFTLPFSKKK